MDAVRAVGRRLAFSATNAQHDVGRTHNAVPRLRRIRLEVLAEPRAPPLARISALRERAADPRGAPMADAGARLRSQLDPHARTLKPPARPADARRDAPARRT